VVIEAPCRQGADLALKAALTARVEAGDMARKVGAGGEGGRSGVRCQCSIGGSKAGGDPQRQADKSVI
jgi:hypothetical protein